MSTHTTARLIRAGRGILCTEDGAAVFTAHGPDLDANEARLIAIWSSHDQVVAENVTLREQLERKDDVLKTTVNAVLMLGTAEIAGEPASVPQPAVPKGWEIPFQVETDKHEVVSIVDANGCSLPFELNTHTQRSLGDLEGLAEELRDAQTLANFMAFSMNAAAPEVAPLPDPVREQLVEALKAMLGTQPNANDGRAGGHQYVTAEDVEACRQARAALLAAGVTP